MKRLVKSLLVFAFVVPLMTSCYSHKFVIGNGPQTGVQNSAKNSFFLYGLIPGKVSDPQELAGGATDFEVTEVHTFVDQLIGVLTLGIYTPTTTEIQK